MVRPTFQDYIAASVQQKDEQEPTLPKEMKITLDLVNKSWKKSGPESIQKEAAATAYITAYEPHLWVNVHLTWAGQWVLIKGPNYLNYFMKRGQCGGAVNPCYNISADLPCSNILVLERGDTLY